WGGRPTCHKESPQPSRFYCRLETPTTQHYLTMSKSLHHAASAFLRYALLSGLSAAFLFAEDTTKKPDPTKPATTEAKKEETQTLEKFEVTGSRIKRLDAETP